MQISPTTLSGVMRLKAGKLGDERGYLVRTCCEKTFEAAGLNTHWRQASITCSPIRHTLRGMHFQQPPYAEIKLIRCLTGVVWDCLVDVRPDSPSYGKWEAFELSEENSSSLYVPAGIAHGFLTLTPDVRLHYSMSAEYSASHACGLRWNDPALAIRWPASPVVISDKDLTWPLLNEP